MLYCDRFARLSFVLGYMCGFVITNSAQAQIIPDDSLGSESSVVTPNVTIKDSSADLIEGGAVRDSNLFHSFSDFNVDNGNAVYFDSPEGINNILTRVTGNNVSNIFGKLGVNGVANLFLLNPNGIVFGKNSALDINGSFLATTAESYIFDNDFAYSASNPETPPLLTVNIPVGLQFGDRAETIVNRSQILTSGFGFPLGLQLPEEKEIALLGGDLEISGGIHVPQGNIILGSVSPNSFVSISGDDTEWQVDYQQVEGFQDISLINNASVDSSGEGEGKIQFQGRQILLQNDAIVSAFTMGADDGGNINFTASEEIIVTGENANNIPSNINASTFPNTTGKGSNIFISTPRLSLLNGAQINARINGEGDGGDVVINAQEIEAVGTNALGATASGILVRVEDGATGNGGDLTIDTDRLLATDGAIIRTGTRGSGESGDLIIDAREIILDAALQLPGFAGGLSSSSSTDATGRGGDLTITTETLFIEGGAAVRTGNRGVGDGGNLSIQAQNIELGGRDSYGNISEISTRNSGSGNGGEINLVTETLTLNEGSAIVADIHNLGNSGNINISADDIQLVGGINSQFDTTIAARVLPNFETGAAGTGDGGNINVQTENLTLDTEASISSSVFSEGNGGDIAIAADRLQLKNGGQITTGTFASGDSGNLTIDAQDISITHQPDSVLPISGIYTDVSFQPSNPFFPNGLIATGKGGDLNLRADNLEIVNGGLISSSVRGDGNGGNITISTKTLKAINGSQIGTGTFANGDAGNLTVSVSELIALEGYGTSADPRFNNLVSPFGSGLLTSVEPGGLGNGGNLTVETPNLKLIDGGSILANTLGTGNAGDIAIAANNLEVRGVMTTVADTKTGINSSVEQSGVGKGGNIQLDVNNLSLFNGGTIAVDTKGQGDAGNIEINAQNTELAGVSEARQIGDVEQLSLPATISASSDGDFAAGNIAINSERLQLSDRANISVSNLGNGNSGNLNITTSRLELNNSATIEAKVNSGSQGNINLATNNIFLDNQGKITAVASGTAQGGNINVNNADNIVLLNNSQIIADAIQGMGGNIDITTQGYFISADSVVSASSEFGLDGTIDVDTINGDRKFESGKLPKKTIRGNQQMIASCGIGANQFAISGKGGLPNNPTQSIRGQAVWQDMRIPTILGNTSNLSAESGSISHESIVEATSWQVNYQGQIELVAVASNNSRLDFNNQNCKSS